MDRKDFLELITWKTAAATTIPSFIAGSHGLWQQKRTIFNRAGAEELKADLVIAGGGMGGCAAALGALRNGLKVIMTEETEWIGGQLTSQGVPPDEHWQIESHGSSDLYRQFRTNVREYYRRHYPLTDDARSRENLNPGDGSVSRLCHEPRVALAVLQDMMAPWISSGKLTVLTRHRPTDADVTGDRVQALKVEDLESGRERVLNAPWFVDATELGDLLPITGTEYRTGTEAQSETGELHAPDQANPDNHQSFTTCFAIDYVPGENLVIDKPDNYDFWRNYEPEMNPPWPGRALELNYPTPSNPVVTRELGFDPTGGSTGNRLNLWIYRRIINRLNFTEGFYQGDTTIVNWPQNDYFEGNLFDDSGFAESNSRGIEVSREKFDTHFARSRELSLSLFYWLQTEAPRPDGGQGWPGLRLRSDLMGTDHGVAMYPYVRESRRIEALFTVLEEHVGRENRAMVTGGDPSEVRAPDFSDSVGVGYYHIDLHPSSRGDNYIDFGSLPFQIPLGSLIPVRMENLLPANKNIGTTHITNGCYRLHPVEWCIGESVGTLVAWAAQRGVTPRAVREDDQMLAEFQNEVRRQGIETHWPESDQ